MIQDRKAVLEEQIRRGEPLKPTDSRKYLDFLDILLTSKVGSVCVCVCVCVCVSCGGRFCY